MNERAVELPIAIDWIAKREGRGLELGNVLSHYGVDKPRVIVDRYEPGVNVVNTDVFDLSPNTPVKGGIGGFDWILSISTVEHVGWDEPGVRRSPGVAVRAVHHLRSLLADDGHMLITAGLGQNPSLDAAVRDGQFRPTFDAVMVRDTGGEWHESSREAWRPYGVDTPWASACWLGEWGE